MAVQTIGYGDKQFLNENADIPATNKVQDSDMNEIKTVVNNNANNIGDLSNLETSDKTSLVNALNSTLPITLYDDSIGALSVTLSDSVTNYNYIEIFYRSNDSFYDSIKVYQPDGKQALLSSAWIDYSGSTSLKLKIITISGTSIAPTSTNKYGQFGIGGNTGKANTDCIYITKVLGYK